MSCARLLLLPALVLNWLQSAVAQPPGLEYSDTTRVEGLAHPPRWVVSLAPLALLGRDNTVQVGVERLLSGPFSVLGEVGYGPSSLNLWPQNRSALGRETWRGRLEGRLYRRRSRIVSGWRRYRRVVEKPLGNYLALDLFYKQVNANQAGSVGRACEDGFTCQYYQRFQERAVKFVWGAHVKVGKQITFAAENDSRFVADLYVGLGARRRIFRYYSRPEPEDAGFYYLDRGNELTGVFGNDAPVTLSVAAGLRIGYVF